MLNEIVRIQSEYLGLLSNLLPQLKCGHSPEVLDEINLFWVRHIGAVQLYLKSAFGGDNSYVFTASTFLDYEDAEHFPFLLLGDKHILDDPLGKYSEICNRMPAGQDAKTLYAQIVQTAEDNIKIITNCRNYVYILPLRLLSQSQEYNSLFKIGEQVFLNLFADIEDLNDYFQKCTSFDDVLRYARKDIDKLVLFTEHDRKDLSIRERFQNALADNKYLINIEKPDSYNFFVLVFGPIQQAIDIIASCIEYNCIPYIRYPISLHYISLILKNFSDLVDINNIGFKMSVAYILHHICDKSKLTMPGLYKFIELRDSFRFDERLFHTLAEHGINKDTFLRFSAGEVIGNVLTDFYDYLGCNLS